MPRRARFDRFALDQLIGARGGLVTRRELKALGVPDSTVQYRTASTRIWQPMLPGVILTSNGTPTRDQREQAALLYAGSGSMLTGTSALARYGIRNLPDDVRVHVLICHERRRLSTPSVTVERSRRLPAAPRSIDALPCAPLPRACIDAARRLRDRSAVRALISEVIQRRRTTVAALAGEIRAAQIRGTALPRSVIREVSQGVRSVAEAEVRQLLLRAGVPEPLWNQDIYDRTGRWLARPDAVWLGQGVVLEIDSLEWHLSPPEYQATQARHRRLTAVGILVVHVTPGTAKRESAAFLLDLRATLATAEARPAPVLLLTRI